MSESTAPLAGTRAPDGIDPRGPRFAASVTSVLLAATLVLALIESPAALPALVVVALLFVWGVGSPATAPWGVVFRRLVRPRLAPPVELEDPRPPRFAQLIGLLVTGVGVLLALLGVPGAVVVASALAFVAAFLNAVFGLCLGCQLWLVLQRVGLVGRAA